MANQPDVPGPGEDVGPDVVPTNNVAHPVPGAELAASQQSRDWQRSTHEIAPWRASHEPGDRAESNGTDILRRTGTEQMVVRLVSDDASQDATEQRADHSALDLARESSFDPTQDESGSQSD